MSTVIVLTTDDAVLIKREHESSTPTSGDYYLASVKNKAKTLLTLGITARLLDTANRWRAIVANFLARG